MNYHVKIRSLSRSLSNRRACSTQWVSTDCRGLFSYSSAQRTQKKKKPLLAAKIVHGIRPHKSGHLQPLWSILSLFQISDFKKHRCWYSVRNFVHSNPDDCYRHSADFLCSEGERQKKKKKKKQTLQSFIQWSVLTHLASSRRICLVHHHGRHTPTWPPWLHVKTLQLGSESRVTRDPFVKVWVETREFHKDCACILRRTQKLTFAPFWSYFKF